MARVRVIDACLGGPGTRYWSKEMLLAAILEKADIRVQERTLLNDIYVMRYSTQLNYHAPIKYCQKGKGYHYTDPDYSIQKLPLSESDIHSLELAAAILGQYKHVSTLAEFSASIDKVVTLVNQLKKTEENSGTPIIDFEKAPFSKGTEYLEPLLESIKAQKVVEVLYHKFNEEKPDGRVVSPLLLKEYRNRWYLLGVSHEKEEIRTFGLDRIAALLQRPEEKYKSSPSFDADTYFRNTIGISYEKGSAEEVVLSFTPFQGNYIKTQHLHATQEILADNEQEFRIKIKVAVNYELVSTILGFGEDVEVIQPSHLRDRVFGKLRKSFKLYASI